jgi:hypothetical protein
MFLLGNWKIYVLELWIILFLLRDILILVLHGIYKKLEFIATFRLMKVSFFFFSQNRACVFVYIRMRFRLDE